MNALVTYQSKTGFTEKYAGWIAEALSCDIREVSKVTASDVAAYDLVVHGGWIMGGMVNGLDKIKSLLPRKLLVFGVGFTPKEETDSVKMIELNKLGDTPFYYFEGGMNPKKMGFLGRIIVKAVTKKAPIYEDRTDKNEINELIKAVCTELLSV